MKTKYVPYGMAATMFAWMVMNAGEAPAGEKWKIVGERVNVRAGPGLDTKVVVQVSGEDILEDMGRVTNGWLAVVPPDRTDLWIYGDLVKDGVATVPKLHIRAGPGINYQSVGRLEKGEKVEVREEWQGWLKIKPPAGTCLWIATNFVAKAEGEAATEGTVAEAGDTARALDEDRGATRAGSSGTAAAGSVVRKPPMPERREAPVTTLAEPVRAPEPTTASPPAPGAMVRASPPAVLAGKDLVAGVVQGRSVAYTGRLRPVGFVWRRPCKYRLVDEGGSERGGTACYVMGNDDQLAGFEGQLLTIHGKEYWIQGVRYSVVIPDRLTIPEAR